MLHLQPWPPATIDLMTTLSLPVSSASGSKTVHVKGSLDWVTYSSTMPCTLSLPCKCHPISPPPPLLPCLPNPRTYLPSRLDQALPATPARTSLQYVRVVIKNWRTILKVTGMLLLRQPGSRAPKRPRLNITSGLLKLVVT